MKELLSDVNYPIASRVYRSVTDPSDSSVGLVRAGRCVPSSGSDPFGFGSAHMHISHIPMSR